MKPPTVFSVALGACLLMSSLSRSAEKPAETMLVCSLRSGRQQAARVPSRDKLKVEHAGNTLGLYWGKLRKLERQDEESFAVTLANGSRLARVSLDPKQTLAARSDWGTMTIELQNVNSIEVQPAGGADTEKRPETDAPTWTADYVGNIASTLWNLRVKRRQWWTREGREWITLNLDGGRVKAPMSSVKEIHSTDQRGELVVTLAGGETFPCGSEWSQMRADCRWGDLVVPLRNIKRLRQAAAVTPLASPADPTWKCTLTSGRQLTLGNVSAELNGTFHAFSLKTILKRLGTFSVDAASGSGRLTVSLVDGASLPTLQCGDECELKGKSRFGETTLPLRTIAAAERISGGDEPAEKSAWRVYGADGAELEVVNCAIEHAHWNQLPIHEFNWDHIREAKRSGDGSALLVRLDDDNAVALEGSLSGDARWGTYAVESKAVDRIENLRGMQERSSHPIVGALQSGNDNRLAVRGIKLSSKDVGGYEWNHPACWPSHICLSTDTHDWWIAGDLVERIGFEKHGDAVVVKYLPWPVRGTPHEDSNLDARIAYGRLKVPLENEHLAAFVPKDKMRAELPKPVVGGESVHLAGWGGRTAAFQASSIAFATYPSHAPSGNYARSHWPFKWQTRDFIVLKTADGTLEVPFSKLASVTLPQKYDSARKIVLHSRSGSAIEGALVPAGENRGLDYKHVRKDGILCRLGCDEVQAFVPFARVKSIRFTQMSGD